MISASREARDLKSPMTTHQISLSISPMRRSIARFATLRQWDRVCDKDTYLEVQTEEHRQAAAALPEGAINTNGRFSLSPASPEIIADLDHLLKAASVQETTSAGGAKSESASAMISADLWRQLKAGALVLAASFDEQDNLAGWWEAVIVRVDDGEFLVRWRDDPKYSPPLGTRRGAADRCRG
jgi:hypothetical protein